MTDIEIILNQNKLIETQREYINMVKIKIEQDNETIALLQKILNLNEKVYDAKLQLLQLQILTPNVN